MDWLNGKKTYIIAVVMIALGALKFFGFEVPGYESVDAGVLINAGLVALGFRSAIAKS